MSNDLKPCPFCGSGNVRYKEAEHAVECARCKARGSIAPDEEMAIRMWGERAGELKPDSWEKLEEDAAKEVCAYAGAPFSIVNQDRYSCTGCRFDDCSSRKTSCWLQMNSELMARAKRLAGAE